jgi:hypothetical protein
MSTLGAELRARPMPTASASWDHATAMAAYRATGQRISAWWDAADVFDKPSLQGGAGRLPRPRLRRGRGGPGALGAGHYGRAVMTADLERVSQELSQLRYQLAHEADRESELLAALRLCRAVIQPACCPACRAAASLADLLLSQREAEGSPE